MGVFDILLSDVFGEIDAKSGYLGLYVECKHKGWGDSLGIGDTFCAWK